MRGMGELIGSGRRADVYALDAPDGAWVLRRLRDGGDATAEAAVLAHLAAHGYPVPRLHPAPPGEPRRTDLVMQRLDGPTLARAVLGGALTAERAGGELAGLLHRLHALPARTGAEPGHRVLHLDLHPENVILTPGGPVVIDWEASAEGPPGLDWAASALILAEAAVGGSEHAVPARAVLTALLRTAPAGGIWATWDDAALARRRADLGAEAGDLGAASALVRELRAVTSRRAAPSR